jgi:hypothetical protein
VTLIEPCADVMPRSCETIRGRSSVRSNAVAACGLAPVSLIRVYGTRHSAIEQSDEMVTKAFVSFSESEWVPAPVGEWRNVRAHAHEPPLHGTRLVMRTPAGLEVLPLGKAMGEDPADLPPDVARIVDPRVRGWAAPIVGWPGQGILSRRLAPGQRVAALEKVVALMADLHLRGEAVSVAASVVFDGARDEEWGTGLVFDVERTALWSNGGDACPRRTSEEHLVGELVLRDTDGAFVALRVRGPLRETETPCLDQADGTAPSPSTVTCNVGEIHLEIGWGFCAQEL